MIAYIIIWEVNNNNINKLYSQLQMVKNIEQDLYRMVQAITINAHYPCYLGNLNILMEYEFYFDICQIIFPQLNIKLIKIKESQDLNPEQKMQKLIDLLSQELEIDLSSIKGAQIIKSHVLHVHRFLQVLQKFSQYHQANSKEDSGSRRVKSDPNNSSRISNEAHNVPRSARQKVNQQIIDQSEDDQVLTQAQKVNRKNSKKGAPTYSVDKKQHRNRSETCKNLYGSLVNIMMNEKNRAMKASLRDNRKTKNEQIIQAKNKYKSYLINYAKQNRATKNRQSMKKSNSQKNHKQLPMEDFDKIQNFFQSFQYKLRDQKYCYLKRIQKIVRTQQIDRMCYFNKIQRQKNKEVKKSTKKQMDRIDNEHRIRKSVLKQQHQSQKQANKLMKRQYQRYLRTQKKQLKQNKKRQLQKIKDFMQQQNGKVLINLEEGGRLQKIILDMYKRF